MELVKNSYLSGDVFRLSIEDIDTFFESKYPWEISNSGTESFLKSLKIPVKYFLQQPDETKKELLINKKNSMAYDSELLVLVRNNIVEYVSLVNTQEFLTLHDRTPINSSWILLEEDLNSGYIRYFITDDLNKSDYNFGAFLDFPVLFGKPMIVNLGFYKINPEDNTLSVELIVPNTKIKLKKDNLPETEHNTYFEQLIISAKEANLDELINKISSKPTNTEATILDLLNLEKEKLINKGNSKKIRKYIEKEDIMITDRLQLVEIMISFTNNLKSYGTKLKYKTEVLGASLKLSNIPVDTSFIVNYRQGF